MADLKALAGNIASTLMLSPSEASDLGDHLYPDIEAIVEGKLRDRYDTLIGKKTRDKMTITEERICNTVRYATSGILEGSGCHRNLVSETAAYYRIKYEME